MFLDARFCTRCSTEKPLTDFAPRPKNKRGCTVWCRNCQGLRKTAGMLTRPTRATLQKEYVMRRCRPYNLAVYQYHAKMKKQNGACMICKKIPEHVLQIDHDHHDNNGRVRGLLCAPCNQGLGMFRDDPALLRAAAEYLEK